MTGLLATDGHLQPSHCALFSYVTDGLLLLLHCALFIYVVIRSSGPGGEDAELRVQLDEGRELDQGNQGDAAFEPDRRSVPGGGCAEQRGHLDQGNQLDRQTGHLDQQNQLDQQTRHDDQRNHQDQHGDDLVQQTVDEQDNRIRRRRCGRHQENVDQQDNPINCLSAVDTLARDEGQAFQFYMQHGFVIIDLGHAPDVYSAVAATMAATAATTPENRGLGHTCVNNIEKLSSLEWAACYNMIGASPIVSALLAGIATHFKLSDIVRYDAGGDYVAPLAPWYIDDPTWDRVGRHPTLWHRDVHTYADWFIASVLVHEVAEDQGPMQIQSWSGFVNASFHGHQGLCLIRDGWCLHRATRNQTERARAMPSFRFRSGSCLS